MSATTESIPRVPRSITKPIDPKADQELPKLSAEEFRQYDKLAVMMNAYHNHFRHVWKMLYTAAESGERQSGMSIRQFLAYGLQLCRSLNAHHSIEERYIFPELAERMPIFADNDHLIGQHHQIHEGIEKLEEYLQACLYGDKELRMSELKGIMDTFGVVLWSHLDDEVATLGAENMRKYYSAKEIANMNW